MNKIQSMVYDRCVRYLDEIEAWKNVDNCFTQPFSRYVLSVFGSLPVKHIFIVERPYATNIHPSVSSAMSYDPEVSGPTPSTQGMAENICQVTGMDPQVSEQWFRDSWKYSKSGILLFNVCTYKKFTDPGSLRERDAFQSFVIYILTLSMKLSKDRIHIYTLGNPAEHTCAGILSGLGNSRSGVTKHFCPNPASSKYRAGDGASRVVTIKKPGVYALISKLIYSTIYSAIYTKEDFFEMSQGRVPTQADVVSATDGLFESLMKAENFFRTPGSANDPKGMADVFGEAKVAVKKFSEVISSSRIGMVLNGLKDPSSAGKSAFYGTRQPFVHKKISVGTASQVSNNAAMSAPIKLRFADEEEADHSAKTPTSDAFNTGTASHSAMPIRPARSVSGRSVFADLSDDDEDVVASLGTASVPYSDTTSVGQFYAATPLSGSSARDAPSVVVLDSSITLSDQDVEDMGYVSSFVYDNEDMAFPDEVMETISSVVLRREVNSAMERELLDSVRRTRKSRSVANALGLDSVGIMDVPSPIYQCLLKYSA